MKTSVCLILSLSAAGLIAAETLPSGPGLAAKYPGDAGIEKDPEVVQVESFEQADIDTLAAQWESVKAKQDMTFSADVPAGSAGKQSLLMDRQDGPGGALFRRLRNEEGGFGHDCVFARYYVKFSEDCGELHHFGPCLGGQLPASPWPSVKAGIPTDGAKSFWSGIEPFGKAWTWDYYTYWCEMGGSPPRGQTWGNSFIHDPSLTVTKGRWICIEQMIRMNDVGDTNGEQALWIDGKLVSHLGKGFPKGQWTFDKFQPGRDGEGVRWSKEKNDRETIKTPKGGAPFEGFRWRTVPELNVNYVWLYVYTEKPAGHRIRVWYDHVVVATEYIGPLQAK
jgi:hypothetical protein